MAHIQKKNCNLKIEKLFTSDTHPQDRTGGGEGADMGGDTASEAMGWTRRRRSGHGRRHREVFVPELRPGSDEKNINFKRKVQVRISCFSNNS